MQGRRSGFRATQRGLSIIELMVGIVVAMLVGLAAAGSAIMFTASQRQGIGAGGVAVNAGTSLAAIKNDAAVAGLGFFGDSAYLCNTMNLGKGAAVQMDGAAFVPVRITEEGTDDRVDIVYASSIESGANVLTAGASNGASVELLSYMPATVNQAVLLAPETPGTACLVRTVTNVVASTDTAPQRLDFAAGGLHNDAVFTVAPAFPTESRVALLGELTWHRYRRNGTTLVMERPLEGDEVVLARNVMALRMQYGITAAAGQTTLQSWQDATGADFGNLGAAALPRVRALRIGVVTRSPQREKEEGGACRATETMPQLFGEDIVPDVADWRCYRFRTSVVVVPLRNLVYGFRVPV